MGVRQVLSGGTEAWDLPTTCGPLQESVIARLLSLSPRAWGGNSLRDLRSNLFLSGSLKYSFQSFCRQSDETNGKTHYRLTWPMMRGCRVGIGWKREEEPKRSWPTGGDSCSQQPRSTVSPLEDGEEAQWRRSVVLLVLELLMWLETSAVMDSHGGWGGVHGVAQLMGSTTEGTSLCGKEGKSVSRAGTTTTH